MNGFRQAVVDAVNTRSRSIRIQLLACSDEDKDIGWSSLPPSLSHRSTARSLLHE